MQCLRLDHSVFFIAASKTAHAVVKYLMSSQGVVLWDSLKTTPTDLENEFFGYFLRCTLSQQASEALSGWCWFKLPAFQASHYAGISGAESQRAFSAVMWAYWHCT